MVLEVRIGEASRTSGVSVRSLRFYEDEGLIVPGRCSNDYRDYCQSTLDRVHLIRSLLGSGLSVRLIRELLPRSTEESNVSADPLCADFLAKVRRYRDRLADRVVRLETQRSALDGFLEQARNSDR